MVSLENYVHDLKFQDGIWHAIEKEKLSYPDDGNDLYYEIEDQSFWFINRNKIIHEVVKKYSIEGPIFDVGGGNGYVSKNLCNNGYEAVLVEPCIDGCINARKRDLKNIINSNFDINSFNPNSIPNIGIFDVLEHIADQNKYLDGINKLILPNGRLFITVPALSGLWSEEDNQAGHYRRYRIMLLHKLFENCGFEVLYKTHFFSFLVLPIFLFRTIPSIFDVYYISSKKSKNQHLSSSHTNKLLDLLMKFELQKVKKNKSIILGSSILLVARKR